MSRFVRDVMTPEPQTVQRGAPATEAARRMSEMDVGAVLVVDGGQLCGIVTDRDIVVRAVAEGRDPSEVTAGEISSDDPTTLSPDDAVDEAVSTMRERKVRRLPVV